MCVLHVNIESSAHARSRSVSPSIYLSVRLSLSIHLTLSLTLALLMSIIISSRNMLSYYLIAGILSVKYNSYLGELSFRKLVSWRVLFLSLQLFHLLCCCHRSNLSQRYVKVQGTRNYTGSSHQRNNKCIEEFRNRSPAHVLMSIGSFELSHSKQRICTVFQLFMRNSSFTSRK